MADYYKTSYQEYFDATFSVDPSPFLEAFANVLPQGALVLDVGCGSGRDLLWPKERGFPVIGFEQSIGLADLARQNVGCEVIEQIN